MQFFRSISWQQPFAALALAGGWTIASVMGAAAAEPPKPGLNFYGSPGLMDMPTAHMMPDGELSASFSYFGGNSRTALNFQITPWMAGTFRYSGVNNLNFGGYNGVVYYDRSFDLRLRLLQEGDYRPALTLGLQDFVGTGLYSGEYIVATKTLTPKLTVSAGLGWGRLSKTGTRPFATGTGGQVQFGTWFTGNPSPFAGVEWRPNDRLGIKLEYSSDAYDLETIQRNVFDRKSDVSVGFEYQVNSRLRLGGYYAYGAELGLSAQISVNPKRPTSPLVITAPPPIAVRPGRAEVPDAWTTDWADAPTAPAQLIAVLSPALAEEGIGLEALSVVSAHTVEIRIRNLRYQSETNALGRTARVLSQILPSSVETFRLVPVSDGMPAAVIVWRRSDLEALEFSDNPSAELLAVAGVDDAPRPAGELTYAPGLYPKFSWGISPYAKPSYFDPDQPVRVDFGIRAKASYAIAPGLRLSGSIAKRAFGDVGSSRRLSNSVLPRVRTDGVLYARAGDPALESLVLNYQFRPGTNLYGRLTAGYLEDMFGGVSGEVLWKPTTSRLALGIEANFVQKRDYDMLLGFQNYSVATGHASAYYDFGNGFHGQVDAGRYLAGDWGGTFRLSREFDNGWRIGAFATFTNVSAADFGEGSFDKGIELSVPVGWLLGRPVRNTVGTTIRPIQRDGGARLSVPGRLYEQVRNNHLAGLEGEWARVWK